MIEQAGQNLEEADPSNAKADAENYVEALFNKAEENKRAILKDAATYVEGMFERAFVASLMDRPSAAFSQQSAPDSYVEFQRYSEFK